MEKHKAPAPRAQRGETLAEVLVALLIVALATLLLAAIVSAASQVNIIAREQDDAFYTALSDVESMALTPVNVNMGIYPDGPASTPVATYPVEVYTSEDLTLYKVR